MGELTKDTPKPLLQIKGKTLLEYKLEAMPQEVDEIILSVGYLGDKIREKFGTDFRGKRLVYTEDKEIKGTARSLKQAQNILKGRFLVMMGDDIYDAKAIEECAKYDYSLACFPANRETIGSRVVLDESGQPIDFQTHKLYIQKHSDGGLIFTGLYSMTDEIFKYKEVKMDLSDEWSLPKTFLQLGKQHEIKIVKTNSWKQVTSPGDLN